MKLTSPAFKNNDRIPIKFTADGEDINPELIISDVSRNAKSLVLILDDPDAQRVVGYIWVHWVAFDIPINGDKVKIEENSMPGVSGESTYKKEEYGGPNPPRGTGVHNYHFKVYSLDINLNLPKMSSL